MLRKLEIPSFNSVERDLWQSLITPSLAQRVQQIQGQSSDDAFVFHALWVNVGALVFPPWGLSPARLCVWYYCPRVFGIIVLGSYDVYTAPVFLPMHGIYVGLQWQYFNSFSLSIYHLYFWFRPIYYYRSSFLTALFHFPFRKKSFGFLTDLKLSFVSNGQ